LKDPSFLHGGLIDCDSQHGLFPRVPLSTKGTALGVPELLKTTMDLRGV
jgi:hypothetical protein